MGDVPNEHGCRASHAGAPQEYANGSRGSLSHGSDELGGDIRNEGAEKPARQSPSLKDVHQPCPAHLLEGLDLVSQENSRIGCKVQSIAGLYKLVCGASHGSKDPVPKSVIASWWILEVREVIKRTLDVPPAAASSLGGLAPGLTIGQEMAVGERWSPRAVAGFQGSLVPSALRGAP